MDRENFARLIKRYRYERGISQREFAKLIGTGASRQESGNPVNEKFQMKTMPQ